MSWEEYRKHYRDFAISAYQSKIASRAAVLTLHDYPNTLPEHLRQKLKAKMHDFVDSLRKVSSMTPGEKIFFVKEPSDESGQINSESSNTIEDLYEPTLMLFIHYSLAKDDISNISFDNMLFSQQLIVTYAYLDGFIAESIRTICNTCPDVMKSDKKIDWETLISLGNWERTIEYLIESFVYHFGWDSISDRIKKFQKEFGLQIATSEENLSILIENEAIRNIIVHNGGKVSAEFMRRTGRTDLSLGQQVLVSKNIADKTSDAAILFAGDLFVEISKVFFKKDKNEIGGVLRSGENNTIE